MEEMADGQRALPNGNGDGAKALGELERQTVRASLFTHASLEKVVGRIASLEAYVTELVDNLRSAGLMPTEEATAEERAAEAEGSGTAEADPPAVVRDPQMSKEGRQIEWPGLSFRDDSGQQEEFVPVNCSERMHICHAVCCKLNFALTTEEIDGGKVKWDLGNPYFIRHEEDGYCSHNERGTGRCGIYEDRPSLCRRYSCANDKRIWKDFEGMVLNQEWIDEHAGKSGRIFLGDLRPKMEVLSQSEHARVGKASVSIPTGVNSFNGAPG